MLALHRRLKVTLHAPVTPLNQQLDLLLPEWGCVPLHVPPEAPLMAPQQLWATLAATTQAQVRQTILQILLEVLHDNPTSGEDYDTPPRTACLCLCAPIGSRTSTLLVILLASKPSTMSLYHTTRRGHCDDSAPRLLPAGHCGMPVVMHHTSLYLAQQRRRSPSVAKRIRAPQGQT